MVTVEHVVAAMRLSDQDWKEIEIRKAEDKQLIPARSSQHKQISVACHALAAVAPSGPAGFSRAKGCQ
jgi:hypothetical protein